MEQSKDDLTAMFLIKGWILNGVYGEWPSGVCMGLNKNFKKEISIRPIP